MRRDDSPPPGMNTTQGSNSSCCIRHWSFRTEPVRRFAAGPACGDAVVDWNEIAQQAIAIGRPGPSGAVDSALVQVAVHDAVQAIDKRFEPYHVEVKGAHGSRSAAAAAAAHGVLVGIYPAQATTLDTTYFNYLAGARPDERPGLLVGEKVCGRDRASATCGSQPTAGAIRRRDRHPASGDRLPLSSGVRRAPPPARPWQRIGWRASIGSS